MSLGYDKWLSVYQRYMICNKNCMMLGKNIYSCIFPIPQHVKQKGKMLMLLKKNCQKVIHVMGICIKILHLNYSVTTPAWRNLTKSRISTYHKDLKHQISCLTPDTCIVQSLQYTSTTYMFSYCIILSYYIAFCITWSFLSFPQAKKILLLKVSIRGETGVVKRIASQLHFQWFK